MGLPATCGCRRTRRSRSRPRSTISATTANGRSPTPIRLPATPRAQVLLQPTRVAIRNARLLAQPASLEREGFQLVREASAVGDFEDEAQVRERYYPESIALLRRLTGAAEAVIFRPHAARRPGRARRTRPARTGALRAQRPDPALGAAPGPRPPAGGTRRTAPGRTLPDRQPVASVRPPGAARAAGVAGRPQPGVRRPGGQ